MKDFRHPVKVVVLIAIIVGVLYLIESRDTSVSGGFTPAAQRKPVPNFTVRDLDGRSWNLSDHRNHVVLLNLWATWCPPCREETPGLVRLSKSYAPNTLDVVGISVDDDRPATVRQFVAAYKIPYAVSIADNTFALASAVQGLPTTLLIDQQGRLAKVYVGGTSERVFRADVDTLLSEPSARETVN